MIRNNIQVEQKISLGTVKSYTEDSDNSVDNRVNNFNPIRKNY